MSLNFSVGRQKEYDPFISKAMQSECHGLQASKEIGYHYHQRYTHCNLELKDMRKVLEDKFIQLNNSKYICSLKKNKRKKIHLFKSEEI